MNDVVWRMGQKPTLERKLSIHQFNAITKNIGCLFIAFSTLEAEIEFVLTENLSHSSGMDELIHTVISKLSFSAKAKSSVSLIGQKIEMIDKTKRNKKKLDQFRTKLSLVDSMIEKASSKRNTYAHARWHELMSERFIRTKTKAAKDGVYHSYRKITAEEMEKDISCINKAIGVITTLDEKINEALR